MNTIVISAVNFNEGGPLSVLKDCLKSFQKIYKKYHLDIIVLVHKTSLVEEYKDDFWILEYPLIKSSWLRRLKFEFSTSKKLSLDWSPSLWFALHDISPNVTCKQLVYCHNPSAFYKAHIADIFTDKTFFLFCLFYKFLYSINIKKNEFVVVQQQWLREEFERNYKVRTVVSYPSLTEIPKMELINPSINKRFKFFFPAFPRITKNFETLLKAVKKLSFQRGDFELILTISGNENKYSRRLFKDYGDTDIIKFIGLKSREEVFEIYRNSDCLVFPSKLETWGLPISEFKYYNKPILLPNLKYAHETLGSYSLGKFFDVENFNELSQYMSLLIDKQLVFDPNHQIIPGKPFFDNWDGLIEFVVKKII